MFHHSHIGIVTFGIVSNLIFWYNGRMATDCAGKNWPILPELLLPTHPVRHGSVATSFVCTTDYKIVIGYEK